MNLTQLELFVATVHSGSMKTAAERFYLSQSALSQNIRKLENELGCVLLDRSRFPLKPTPYGEIVLDRAERMLFLAQEIESEIARKKEADATVVRVGCFYTILANSEMAHIANVHKNMRFKVSIADEPSIVDALLNGRYDLALLSKAPSIPGFEAIELGQEELFVSLPGNSALAKADSVLCSQLADRPIVIPDNLAGVTDWYKEVLETIGVKPENVTELSSEDYFSAMNDPTVTHFRSSLMTTPIASLPQKRHLPLSDPEIKRTIIALYPLGKAKLLAPIIDTMRKDRGAIASAISVLPKLLHLSASSNLEVEDLSLGDGF